MAYIGVSRTIFSRLASSTVSLDKMLFSGYVRRRRSDELLLHFPKDTARF
jgi:hypothetical protein